MQYITDLTMKIHEIKNLNLDKEYKSKPRTAYEKVFLYNINKIRKNFGYNEISYVYYTLDNDGIHYNIHKMFPENSNFKILKSKYSEDVMFEIQKSDKFIQISNLPKCVTDKIDKLFVIEY